MRMADSAVPEFGFEMVPRAQLRSLNHGRDCVAGFGAAENDFDLFALRTTDELTAERGLRRDDHDRFSVDLDFSAAGQWPDEVGTPLARSLEFHQRTQINGLASPEFPNGETLVALQSLHDLDHLLGLASR